MGNWLPGARVIMANNDGGSMVGGAPRVVWHTTENDPTRASAADLANYLNGTNNQVHLVWNPVSGEIVQMIPANRAGRGLVNRAGGVQTNRQGSVCIQIEVVGQAVHPFTEGPCKNLDKIESWLTSLGIPHVWPAGQPKPYPESAGGERSVEAWAHGGHFGHSQVPENDHGDPGHVNIAELAGGQSAPVTPEAPAVVTNGVKPSAVVEALQTAVRVPVDGIWGPGTDKALRVVAGGPGQGVDIRWLQTRIGTNVDGVWGPSSAQALQTTIRAIQKVCLADQTGVWDSQTEQKFEHIRTVYKNA